VLTPVAEQKRRQAIRDGFDHLCEIIPGMEGQGRSEGLVLKRTVEYMREQLEQRRRLVQEREARGEVVDEKLKEYVHTVDNRTTATLLTISA
jgi:heteromeric Ino2p/Ino4p transcription factor